MVVRLRRKLGEAAKHHLRLPLATAAAVLVLKDFCCGDGLGVRSTERWMRRCASVVIGTFLLLLIGFSIVIWWGSCQISGRISPRWLGILEVLADCMLYMRSARRVRSLETGALLEQ